MAAVESGLGVALLTSRTAHRVPERVRLKKLSAAPEPVCIAVAIETTGARTSRSRCSSRNCVKPLPRWPTDQSVSRRAGSQLHVVSLGKASTIQIIPRVSSRNIAQAARAPSGTQPPAHRVATHYLRGNAGHATSRRSQAPS